MDSTVADILVGQMGIAQAAESKGASVALRVYDDLRKRIVTMELPPDTVLSRQDLAREYEVSQTPIREAMQRLEQDGLVKIHPQSKTVVTKIDIAQLYESHFLRVAVESEVVRRLALKPNPALVEKLRAIIRMQEALLGSTSNIPIFNELDEAFHHALFAALGQAALNRLVKARGGHLTRARHLDLPKEGKMQSILKDHGAVVDAIEAGDPAAAQEAMRTHLTGTVERMETLQRENPRFFRTGA